MIWIIGSKGMLGRQLAMDCKQSGTSFIATDMDVDITDRQELLAFSQDKGISVIINCSAYTAVDKAEEEEDKAFAVNAFGVENIGKTATAIGAKVIHVSTDYVFPGTENRELEEDDPTGPVSVYGRSKLEGERLLAASCAKSIIVRTAWLYGRYGKNFVYTMVNAMNVREEIKVVHDQVGSPTNAVDLSAALIAICQKVDGAQGTEYWGVYHYSGGGQCTWYEFAKEIYRLGRNSGVITSDCTITPCTTNDYPTPAARPAYSLLSKTKMMNTFGVSVLEWKQSLISFFKSYIPYSNQEKK
ncbi:MAG: dTDP-4-dehydrorhamnose reductase [Bacteroidales bacterium]|nr:dTDP-4-dehydrorhamnose reductase [Bacteroidales bacterium]